MGRSYTPRYRVEFECRTHRQTPAGWNAKYNGRANAANLRRYIDSQNASFQPGGVNDHCGVGATIVRATLIDQTTGDVVATYEPAGANVPAPVHMQNRGNFAHIVQCGAKRDASTRVTTYPDLVTCAACRGLTAGDVAAA